MSSDDYESIDPPTPKVASISDLSRSRRAPIDEVDTSEEEEDTSSMSSNLLEPLHNLFHNKKEKKPAPEEEKEPHVMLREKKTTSRDATVSHYVEDDPTQKFKRRSVERHSMFSDFSNRRSSKSSGYGSGKWTDLFSSSRVKRREARKKLHVNFPSTTSTADDYGTFGGGSIGGLSLASNSSGESTVHAALTTEEVKTQFRNVMLEKNIPAAKVDEIVEAMPTEQMRTMIVNAKRADDAAKKTEPVLVVLNRILKSANVLDCKKDIVTVRIQLQCLSVQVLYTFANEDRDEAGRTGFELICRLYSSVINDLRSSECGSKRELDLIDFLQEIVRCIRTIVNTYQGLEVVLRKNSPVCSLLIQTLICLNRRKVNEQEAVEIRTLRIETATICLSLMLVTHETTTSVVLEMTGQQKFFAELTRLARDEMKSGSKRVSRFRPFVQCLQFFGERDPSQTMRVLLMLNMFINGVDRNTSDGQNWTEEMVWQMRMRLRSEAAKDGLNKYIERFIGENVDSKVREVAEKMLSEQNEDFETLVGKYENLKTEYDSLDSVFEFLATSSEASGVEHILLSLFQLLALIPDDMGARRSYLKLIEVCVSEIVLHRTPMDMDFGEKFVFETPVQDIIEQLQDEEMTKKLRQATAAKQEAVAMQGEYWKAIGELQKETQLLRKHVSDPKSTPLPPPTKINVSAPSTSSNSLPPITGGPPPPPPLPGSGIPPITGGPPPPPPPLPGGGIPPITGGPPPPPPPGGMLPPVRGGPPPPPPPPGMGGGPPPPPPPPGGIGMMPFGAFVPPIPEYLTKKNVKKVDVPMRKFPWGSNTINPRDIPKESFWAHTNEDAITNDGMLERVKNQFSNKTSATSAASKLDVAGKARKVKTAQVIQDDKVLQRLGILQGSLKMTHQELKNAILEVNERVLTPTFLEQLRGCLPPGDVLKKLQEVDKNQFEEMPEGEQFATRLAMINALPLRLDLIEFKMKLSEILGELKPSMSSVMEGCEEIRKSDGLRVFLQLILAFGNYMSGSTKNYTNTYGFEMRMLTRLIDTKDVENKHTLLHHLIREMKRIEPRRARFAITDFHHCVESSRVNAEEMAKTTRMIKISINKLENCLKVYKSQGEKDRFEEKMKPFLDRAMKEFSTVEMMSEKMKNDWESLAKYFAFDTKKYPMEEFFMDIKTFTEQYLTAWKELEAEIEAEAKRAKAADTQTQRRQQKPRQPFGERQISTVPENMAKPINRTPAAMIRVSTASDKAGVLDELERATGSDAFLQTLMSATNSRTPRLGNQARSRTGKAALERQRSRNGGDGIVMGSISMAAPLFSASTSSSSSDTMTAGSSSGVKTSSSALERAKAIGVGLPGQGELKMRVRRKGAPAVPVERAAPESSRISPTHKENRQPATKKESENEGRVPPSTDDLLARLNQL